MAGTSRELLDCNDQDLKPSIIEFLLSSKKEPSKKNQSGGPDASGGRPLTTTVPTSDVLGKVKDFLGVMAKANEKLELDAQQCSPSKYDIEVLDGKEEECIEMDLLLGVADLQNPEAVVAAEATLGSFQRFCNNSVHDDTDDSSEDDDSDDDSDGDHEDKLEKPDSDDPKGSKRKPNKRPKIVVLD